MDSEYCPECGEKTRREKRRAFAKFAMTFNYCGLHCPSCLWTESDPPEDAPLAYEVSFDDLD